MKTRFTSSALLAAVASLALGVAPALAGDPSNGNGYEFPNFWGNAPAQQTIGAQSPNQANGSVGTYVTQTNHGTWLFPPNPYGNG